MKKRKRKGFTLVELLAVIVILAIVVGIAIPTVTSIINNSKRKSMATSLETAGKYLTQQSQLMNVDINAIDDELKNSYFKMTGLDRGLWTFYGSAYTKQLWPKLGLKPKNISAIFYKLKSDGTACIKIVAIPKKSEYYTPGHWELITPEETSHTGVVGNYKPKSSINVSWGTGCETSSELP